MRWFKIGSPLFSRKMGMFARFCKEENGQLLFWTQDREFVTYPASEWRAFLPLETVPVEVVELALVAAKEGAFEL